MKIFDDKQIREITDVTNTVINDIEDFGANIKSELEEINYNFSEQMKSVDKLFENTNSKIDNNFDFSDRVKKRLTRQVELISNELDSENFELSFDLDDSDILENYSTDSRRFLEDKIDLEEHLSFIENKIEEISDRINKISDFCDYKKPKHKLVIEKRNGIIAIKDKNHSDYLKNKELNISIDNDEVLFCKEGLQSTLIESVGGWYIPQSTIDEFKIIKRRLQKILNH